MRSIDVCLHFKMKIEEESQYYLCSDGMLNDDDVGIVGLLLPSATVPHEPKLVGK